MISYDSYRVFYYVSKCRSFTQAARQLLTSQPNITRTIRNLESALGCTLFLRSNHGVSLTPEGARLYEHVAAAVAHLQAGEEELARDKSLQTGLVTIASSEIALHCLLLPALRRFRVEYPGIHLRVQNLTAQNAVQVVKDGLADLAVVAAPVQAPDELVILRLGEFQEGAVCAADLEGLRASQLRLGELSRYPIISLERQTQSYSLLSSYFLHEGAAFQPDIEVATADQILPLVRSGLGVGFVPEDFLLPETGAQNIRVLPLTPPLPKRALLLMQRKNEPLSLAAKAFCHVLRAGSGC